MSINIPFLVFYDRNGYCRVFLNFYIPSMSLLLIYTTSVVSNRACAQRRRATRVCLETRERPSACFPLLPVAIAKPATVGFTVLVSLTFDSFTGDTGAVSWVLLRSGVFCRLYSVQSLCCDGITVSYLLAGYGQLYIFYTLPT